MTDAAAGPRTRTIRAFDYQRLVNGSFALFVFFGMMSVIEPSPYDFLCLIAVPVWFVGGTTIHRSQVMILLLWIVFEAGGLPVADAVLGGRRCAPLPATIPLSLRHDDLLHAVFRAAHAAAERTLPEGVHGRRDRCRRSIGIAAYVDLGGIGPALTTYEGRVSGTFKDPNVFGSYLILAATYLFQMYLFGTSRRTFVVLGSLLLVLLGVFVSFSRGSWGATIVALALMTCAGFLTAETPRIRRRITKMALIVVRHGHDVDPWPARGFEHPRLLPATRGAGTQDYDEGTTGRFGNQIRAHSHAARPAGRPGAAALSRLFRPRAAQFLYRRLRQRRLDRRLRLVLDHDRVDLRRLPADVQAVALPAARPGLFPELCSRCCCRGFRSTSTIGASCSCASAPSGASKPRACVGPRRRARDRVDASACAGAAAASNARRMDRTAFLIAGLGAIAGTAGVIAAAGAAHGSADPLLQIAANMLLFHAAALVGLGALCRPGQRLMPAAGLVLALGTALFSGDLARRALTGERLFPMAAPTGGTLLILGWAVLAVACGLGALRRQQD